MNLEEKTTLETEIYHGRIITLRRDEIELPNGKKSDREFVTHPGGVGIVALTDDGYVFLVNQFRYPYKSEILEIPAGKLDKNEDPLSCGKRELLEETGISAEKYTSLGRLFPSPGYTNEIIYLYLAENLSYGSMDPDDDEFLEVKKVSLDDAVKMVMSGELPDSKTQTALLKTWMLMRSK